VTTVTLPRPLAAARPRLAEWMRWAPLTAVLIVQAVLSARLIHIFGASPDEARDITIGHQLIYELWHGGGSPYYETYLSGAPDLFSPLAAMADHLGGLPAVRLMNLAFMLTCTCLLYLTTRRLYGYGAACAAAALFASLGLTHGIGVYANYDALAFLFMATATYGAVRSQETRWLLLIPPALLAANAAKYMTLAFDPVIIGLAALQAAQEGWRRAGQRLAALAASAGATLVIAAALAGMAYVKGVMFTTIDRPPGANAVLTAYKSPPSQIFMESFNWIGVVVVLGAAALIISLITRRDKVHLARIGLLLAAGFVVTFEALHLGSDESMRQHDVFGAWFTCIAAGYAMSAPPGRLKGNWAKAVAVALTAAGLIAVGLHYTKVDRSSYPLGTLFGARYYALAKPYLTVPGRVLIDEGNSFKIAYEDHLNIPWYDLADDNYIKYPIPGRGGDSHGRTPGAVCTAPWPGCTYLRGPLAYRDAIRAHWFTFISLYGTHGGTAKDKAILKAVRSTPGYVPLTQPDAAQTWIYAPAYRKHTPPPATPRPVPRRHPHAPLLALARALMVTQIPSALFAAAGLLLTALAVWGPRRGRHGRGTAWARQPR
jgi:hypothetical protein